MWHNATVANLLFLDLRHKSCKHSTWTQPQAESDGITKKASVAFNRLSRKLVDMHAFKGEKSVKMCIFKDRKS